MEAPSFGWIEQNGATWAVAKPWVAPLCQLSYFPDGDFGAPGTVGAPGATGAPPAEGAAGAPSGGSGALQKGQLTGRKFGDTIFFPHSGQMSGPDVVSGGLKHITSSSFVTIAKPIVSSESVRSKQLTVRPTPTSCCAKTEVEILASAFEKEHEEWPIPSRKPRYPTGSA